MRRMLGVSLVAAGLAGCASPPAGQRDETPILHEDEDVPTCESRTVYDDQDGDGFGDEATAEETTDCELGSRTLEAGDCDDGLASVNPDADELCNEVDDDCDGDVDEEAVDMRPFYVDLDRDGYGAREPVFACRPLPGFSAAVDGDCNDVDPAFHPGAEDQPCDGIDHDCRGDEEYPVSIEGLTGGFETIQEGLDAVPDRGTVWVCPGTYAESLELRRSTTLRGASDDPEDVIIEPESGQALRAIAPPWTGWMVSLRALTLQGGHSGTGVDESSGYGGNLEVEYVAALTLERVRLLDGHGSESGGGMYTFRAGRMTLKEVTFEGNTTTSGRGGGLCNWQGPESLLIEDSVFRDNTGGFGGGAYAGSGATTVRRTTFEGNTGISGAGLETDGQDASVEDSRFIANSSSRGGALTARSRGKVVVRDTHFERNVSRSGCEDPAGVLSGASVLLQGTTIVDHTCADTRPWQPRVMAITAETDATVAGTTFSHNAYGLHIKARSASVESSTFEDMDSPALTALSNLEISGGSFSRNGGGIVTDFVLDLDAVDFGAGASANDSFDVQTAGVSIDLDGVTTAVCEGGRCE